MWWLMKKEREEVMVLDGGRALLYSGIEGIPGSWSVNGASP